MIRDVQLRAAGQEDLQAIARVLGACGLPFAGMDVELCLYHVAVLNGALVGCAYGEANGRTLHIHAVAVLRAYQGHRIGTYLLGDILMRARANGCKRATTLTPEHPGFFARCGFTLVAEDSPSQEKPLSRESVRRFGARTHYMCRHLN